MQLPFLVGSNFLVHQIFTLIISSVSRILYTNHVGDIDIEWALGAYVVQSSKSSTNIDWSASIIHDDLFLLLSVASVLLVFAIWLLSKWRRPQLKTIFDLEKGRYIVTHVN